MNNISPKGLVADAAFEASLVVDELIGLQSLHGIHRLLAHVALFLLLVHPRRPLLVE